MYRRFFPLPKANPIWVKDVQQIQEYLAERIGALKGRVGLLLSSGLDSAILAKYLPANAVAYTIDYEGIYAKNSEFDGAATFLKGEFTHRRVLITKADYFSAIEEVTRLRKAPTVPHEASVYIACRRAALDGVQHMLAGFGADGRFGGFKSLHLSPRFRDFRKLLATWYIDPKEVLVEPAPVDWVINSYAENGRVDVQRFLTEVGTEGRSAYECVVAAGLNPVFPYAEMALAEKLDLERPEKYLLHSLFEKLYGYPYVGRKKPLWVPYDDWMGGIKITRPEFLPGCEISRPLFRGEPNGVRRFINRVSRRLAREFESRWGGRRLFVGKTGYLLYSLQTYIDLKEKFGWVTPSVKE